MSPEYETGRRVRERRRRKEIRRRRIRTAALACLVLVGALILLKLALPARQPERPAEEPEPPTPVEEPAETKASGEEEPEEPAYALHTVAETVALGEDVLSEFAVLIDADSGAILAEKRSDEKMFPASMTKVLTLLVAAEHMPEEDGGYFTMTRAIADYCFSNECSVVGYVVGEEIPIRELPYGCILCSGADASLALAELCAGSHETFTQWMNEKAAELGLSETARFTNCVGTYDDGHCCTARDMALILKAAMEDEFCRGILTTPVYYSEPTEQHPEGQTLSNWFLRRIRGRETGSAAVQGGKTGYVPQSGNCAASFAVDGDGRAYLCVTGHAGTAWQAINDHILLYGMCG